LIKFCKGSELDDALCDGENSGTTGGREGAAGFLGGVSGVGLFLLEGDGAGLLLLLLLLLLELLELFEVCLRWRE